jgi:UDP-3-O-[3-hydroxymyristoyl] N-acetylglucosamine deacetylase
VTLCAGDARASIADLTVAGTARATTVEARGGSLRVGTVEHAFAAFAGLGVYSGVAIEIEGIELPLLDGGARRWCDAIASLDPPRTAPPLRVDREEIIEVGSSRYTFVPKDGVAVTSRLELPDARVVPDARWDGDPEDFRRRIAPARTFCRVADFDELGRLALARHVDPDAVVVLSPDAVYCRGPFEADEPARHKLLDLLGDLYLYGGPPRGLVRAVRPGHTANAEAIRRAIDVGVLVRDEATPPRPVS